MRKMIFAVLLGINCFGFVSAHAQEGDLVLGQVALGVLYDEMQKWGAVDSRRVLGRVARETGLEEGEMRRRLGHLLVRAEVEGGQQSEAWKGLLELRDNQIKVSRADAFLHNLIEEGEKILQSESPYLLSRSVRWAARKARLAVEEEKARSFALKVVKAAGGDDGDAAEAEDYVILVRGRSNRYEINKDPLFLFFDSRDEAFVMEEVREIHRFMVPAVVRVLPQSPLVKWAVRQRETNALVDPDYHLNFTVDNLSFKGSNLNVRPCMEATVELFDGRTEALLWSEQLEHCTEAHGSKTAEDLHPFYAEVAQKTYELVEAFFVANR